MSRTPWPHLLAELEAKRKGLDEAIAIVKMHFIDSVDADEMPVSKGNYILDSLDILR